MRSRILIIVFDALRPEFLTADLMPNLHGFARHGVLCTDHHSTFPTEPRVNQSSVTTGCYPRKHGIVANLFPMPGVDGILNTGDDAAFEAMIGDLREPLFGVPQMADILATHGRSYASISAGTPGGARLINLNAQSYGYMRYALRRPAASVPRGLSDRIAEVVGPIPDNTRPMVDWNRHAVEAWLEVIDPQEPDVSLVWLCEPDESFHWHEIGSPESRAAAHGVDAAFGEILHRKRDEIASGNLQIIALSDHGQISLSGGKIGLEGKARAAGFKLDSPSPDYLFYVHNAGGIWVRDSDPDLIVDMTDWLLAQSFTGPVFTRDGLPGTLRHADICADHPRAPDIYLTLAHDDGTNAYGLPGLSADNSPYPEGGGCHGGLSRYELNNVLVLGGSAFGQGQNAAPTGNVDILPTVLHLLGLPLAGQLDGRVLHETFVDGPRPPEPRIETLQHGQTHLRISRIGNTPYLDRGWAELSHS